MHIPVQEMFRQAAERCAGRPAIEWEGRQVSYRQLESQAARLARDLRAAGAERGSLVAILASRTADVIAAMLAVLDTRCAFVPIDLQFSAATLPSIVAEARPRLWLAGERQVEILKSAQREHGFDTTILPIAEDWVQDPGEGLRLSPPAEPGDPDAISYVYFTSGSTGRPKGIAGRLQAIDHFIRWEIETFGVAEGTRVSQLTSPAFDAFLRDAFTPLAAGGTVCVPAGRDSILDGGRLAEWIERQRVELLHCTPSLFRLILGQELTSASFPALRWVLLAGEPLLPSDVLRWHNLFADRIRLVNLYGPSETTMVKLFHLVRPEDGQARTVSIGRPIPGARAIVVDEQGKPCPPGKLGEIYIRTRYRSLGYLNRPDLTAESFVQNPFSDRTDDIVYKTGDLGRLQEDGSFELVGRRDTQVKVRGVRVEIAPIEDLLRAQPSVADVAVVDRLDTQDNRFLCAYIVPRGELNPSVLAEALRGALPDSAVPSAFVTLEALPRTLSGKVDRRALSDPGQAGGQTGREYVAPSTPVEEALCEIFSKLLGIAQVGIRDNFFELGGHSLLATLLLSRIRSALGVEIPLREVFRTPAVQELAATLARLRGAIPRASEGMPEERITARSREDDPPPLSYAQQRLWFIDRLEPGNSLYNMPAALRVSGPLDPETLARALSEVVRRHEALRTVFAAPGGSPVQVIQPAVPFVLPLVDLSGLPARSRAPAALLLAGEEAGRPFDLASGPLLRGVSLRLAASREQAEHIVALTMHHIVSDAWSMGLLVRELTTLYAAFVEGRPSPLPELPVQYADFSVWQRSWLRGEVLENEISFWRRQLAGLPPLLELPTDRPRPGMQSYRGASRPLLLPAGLTRQAMALARSEGATLFMVLLAAFQALLARHSGQDDLAVGSPVAGRNRQETEELIGFFVNTLVLRGDLSGDPSFRKLLGQVRETALAAHLHQDVPFEKLVKELSPARSLAQTPLFQVMLVLQNAPAAELRVAGLTFSPAAAADTTSKFDLTLSLTETPDGLSGAVEYAADLFDSAAIKRFIGHLSHLLASATADPETLLSELRLMDAAEERQLVQSSRDRSGRTWALPVTVHDLFWQQAGRAPDRNAAVGPQGSLTYGELAERSSALAVRIQSVLPRPLDRPVALLTDADLPVLAGMLGILRAGAGFLPLDPRHPDERLAWALEDSSCEVLVTRRRYLDRAKRLGLRHVLCLEDVLPSAPEPGNRAESEPRSLAYIVYTSGSTGRPKGVQISHENLVPVLLWGMETFGLGASTRVLQNLSFCFDFGIFEHLTTLLAGGALIFPGSAAGDPLRLAHEIVRQDIDTLHTTPAFARELAAAGLSLGSLEVLHLGGETLAHDTVARLRRAAPRATIYNGYGPTEATVTCSTFRIGEPDSALWSSVPIGRPSADNALYILDRTGRLVPFGVRGDLHVGGIGVARGYLNRPDLTAERFVPDPFGPVPGGRLYRTGDLVRHLPGGDCEFLGRLDHQVKIRGFRIELGEIEAVLCSLPGVREAVVMARQDTPVDRRLVAYLVGEATAETVRRALRERLPDYMVPAAFVTLAELPLTPNGKVDRKALPPAERSHTGMGTYSAPRSTLEQTIAEIWREVLGLDQVSRDDNFFDAGGHSLLMIRVHARLRELLHRDLTVVELFQYPTVRALAEHLSEAAPLPGAPVTPHERPTTGFAVIGMAGRFPGAANVEELWLNLRDGREAVVTFTDEEMRAAGVHPKLLDNPLYVKAGSVLEGIEFFDAEFFGFSPREAEMMDPQHRLFLETSWQALEDAGYAPRSLPGRVGVWGGAGLSTYAFHLLAHPDLLEAAGLWAAQQGIDKDFLAAHVSYKLNLRGPSVTVQTACSTSLVTVHHACRSLASGECDTALAGGVHIHTSQRTGYLFEEGAINSPDGHCRAFDAKARGTFSGSGVGVIVLKRLEDALRDGDTIRSVIRGTAINNDGSLKVGFTAPSVDGQAEVIAAAQAAAGVSPATISYIEAHGTGTPLGDPIEVAALTRAFHLSGTSTEATGFCGLGSIKSNLGHLGTAAGVAGLIKTVLALEHRQIPPSLHFETPSPAIDFAASPFRVVDRLTDWEPDRAPRRAGVSSFGIGGTNAHAVLEEAPQMEPSGSSRPHQLLLLSARTPGALEEATARLTTWLESHPEVPLADVAHTLRRGRHPFEHRRMLVCTEREDALAALQTSDPERLLTRRREGGTPPMAWLLPGQGSQHPGMGRDLYETEHLFRREIDSCAEILSPRLGRDLREILFSSPGAELASTRFAQPALFAVEHALARLWLSWGLRPQALLGHSLGEYVAACLGGVLSVEDALTLVAVRGELMQDLPPGAMLSVDLSEGEALAEIAAAPGLSLAAVNNPGQCVVSGSAEEIETLAERLARRSSPCRRLHTSHAFHSRMMEPILGRFAESVSRVELRPPSIPYLSNLTGSWVTAAEATDPWYWARHLRAPVRFGDGTSSLLAELPPGAVLLEVGPGKALGRLVRGQAAGRTILASMPHPGSGQESGAEVLSHAVGRLWLAGVEIDWQAYQGEEKRHRVSLPTYPFQRRRHWVEPGRQSLPGTGAPVALLLPENAAADPAWTAALESRGFRVIAVPSGQSRPEALDELLALRPPTAEKPSPPDGHPDSGHSRPGIDTLYEEPRTDIERRLATIWGDLLGIDAVGIHDDFFELGGHSLLATRLLSRLRGDFGCDIPLETIFAAPTVSRLAAHLAAGGELLALKISPILPAPHTHDRPLSFAQQRLLFLAVMSPGDASYNLPLGLRLDGRLDTRALRLALDMLVARHEPLRTTFRIDGNQVTQTIAPAPDFPLPLADLAGLPAEFLEAEVRRLALEQARHPFDLLRGPVVITLLVRLAPAEHLLLLTVHHIAADGWSFSVLYRDMTELYRAIIEKRRPQLPELPVQYADFAAWQRTALQEEALERHLVYWRDHLAGARALALPTDRPRPLHPSGRGAALVTRLPAETVDAARRLARDEDATLFMVLLGAFATMLHHTSGCDDLVIGTDIANRTHRETEDLIGLFVNQLVLRNDLSGDPTFRELVRRVRRISLEAYTHQDAPFDRLVEALNPVRDLDTTPLFQVKLVLQNARMPVHEITDLKVSPLEVHNQTAKFDLLLNLTEVGNAISGALEYRTDLWDEASLRRLFDDFAAVLAIGIVRPDEHLSRIEESLSRSSRQPVQESWTGLRRRAIPVFKE
jgi:amino acid adenylation domain-containing protein